MWELNPTLTKFELNILYDIIVLNLIHTEAFLNKAFSLFIDMKKKIAFFGLGITLLFTFILVWAIKKQSTDRVFKDQGILLHEIAYQAADELDKGMYERFVDILTLSNDQLIKNPNASIADQRDSIEFLQKYFTDYSWIGFTDTNGKVLASTKKLLEGADVSKRPWFQQGIKDVAFGDVHEAKLLSKLLPKYSDEPLRFVDVSAPVTNKKGEIIGVIGAHLSWDWAKAVRESLRVKSAEVPIGELYIINKAGEILLGEKTKEKVELMNSLISQKDVPHTLSNSNYLIAWEDTKGHKNYPGLGWKIVVIQPLELALKPAKELGDKVMWIGLIFSIILGCYLIYISRLLFSPFIDLSEAAKRFSRGESADWPVFTSNSEAMILSTSLSELSAKVEAKTNELLKLNSSLTNLVEERTVELKAATIKAESASEAKSRFLAQMSHEIRTPIHGIMGMTQVLLETDLKPEQRKYSEQTLASTGNLLEIINDILDYSKIEAGKMTLEEASFDLHKLVEDILSQMQYLVKGKSLKLSVDMTKLERFNYLGDSTRLRQIIVNLVGNAIKFTAEGSVELKITSLKNLGNKKSLLRFEIKDTGIGMSNEAMGRLFTSFSQADSSIARNFGGSGLGLAISKQLANLMEGEIGVHSELGKGSTFWFEIQLKNDEAVISKNSVAKEELSFYQDSRILVVDDDGDNRFIAVKALEKVAGVIHTAENGLMAIEMLDAGSYDLVLMDCRMPEMDGFQAARAIRASSKAYKDILIVAMTADAAKEEEVACREAGMNDFITKPIAFLKLRKMVLGYLQK